MKIRVHLSVDNKKVRQDVIEIGEWKLQELSEEEIEAAIEVRVRHWADELLSVSWEVEEEEESK